MRLRLGMADTKSIPNHTTECREQTGDTDAPSPPAQSISCPLSVRVLPSARSLTLRCARRCGGGEHGHERMESPVAVLLLIAGNSRIVVIRPQIHHIGI